MKTMTILAITAAMTIGAINAPAQKPDAMQQMDPKTHRELMPVHAKLMEEQKLQDAEMAKLLAEMNSATGERRIDALVAVVNKLIEQRRAMQEKIGGLLDK
jgi:hypothetical protein